MSNIDQESLIFAIPDDNDPTGEMITCQIPMDNIMKWMTSVYPHIEKYRAIQNHYTTMAIRSGIDNSSHEIVEYSYANGMKKDLQSLMMAVIMDLKDTLGTDDFLDLWKLEPDSDDDEYLDSQNWVGMNNDGSTFTTRIETDNHTKH